MIKSMFDVLKNIGSPELVLIAIILAAVLGGQRIKDIAGGLGESAKELKKVKEELESVKSDVADVVGGVKSDA